MAYTSIVKLVSLSTWRIMHPNVRSLRLKFPSLRLKFPSLLLHKGYDMWSYLFFSFLFFNAELLTQQPMALSVVLRRKTLSKFLNDCR
jgi:hypothetical protein